MTIVKFNFVICCSYAELDTYRKIDPDESQPSILHSSRGDIAWCLRAYLILKKRNKIHVECSNQLKEDCINIIHSDQLASLKGSSNQFIACVQADFPHRPWAHYHFVHNKEQLTRNATFIPFWVQPGLIPRDSSRKGVKRIAYSGQLWNGNFAGYQKDWKQVFNAEGLEFVTISEGAWHDLSSVDVLIGIRSFDKKTYNNKPATKLVNAWHAGIPFIGGNDSAFSQVAQPGKDYMIANNMQELLACVLRLRDNPDLYAEMVENGRKKALEINNQTIAMDWEAALSGPVLQRFNNWKTHRLKEWFRFGTLLGLGMSEYRSKIALKYLTKHSFKILGIAVKF